MVVPSPVCNVTGPCPDRPDGGTAATESTASLVTPKRLVAEPRALCHRNPWLEPNETQVSDWPVALTKFSGILDFVENLLLQPGARYLAQSHPNQHRKLLWSLTVNNHPKKEEISIHLGEGTSKRAKVACPRWLEWL